MTDVPGLTRRSRALGKGDYLFQANERLDQVYLVIEGVLIRERFLKDGRRQIVGLYVPGDICGLAALIDGNNRDGVVSLTSTIVHSMSRRSLLSAANMSGDLAKALWQEMQLESDLSAAWITNIGLRSAYGRIAHLGCELAARGPDSTTVRWPGTQADLGAATGLSVVHVNRMLMALHRDHLLIGGRNIIFYDLDKLRRVASFDASYLTLPTQRLGTVLTTLTETAPGSSVQDDPRSSPMPVRHPELVPSFSHSV